MTAPRDKLGRPVVVVTGMGIMTSLGNGKADNWAKLVAGESGIRTITRFPVDGLRTTMAGTVDFVSVDPFSSTGLSERMAELVTQEALAQAGIGAKADFPGPLFLAVAPVEVEWPQRRELGRAVGAQDITYDDLLRISGGGKYSAYHHRFMFGSVAAYLAETFGTKGSPISLSTACASGATSIQLGVEAIRRGETDAALCVATDGTVNPEALVRFSLLSVAVDPERSAAGGLPPLLQEPRRFCHGRRRRRPRAGKLRSSDRARRKNPRRDRRLRRAHRFLPPHPLFA
ncbi:3-oxoacyl-(acyl-carrier-protein) synthase [Bradyrhizobium sp. i1.3.1]